MTLLNPELVAAVQRDPDLDHAGKVAALAMVLIYQEGGPISDGLSSLAKVAPCSVDVTLALDLVEEALEHTCHLEERVEELGEHAGTLREGREYVEHVDAYLRATLAWSAVEQLLEES